MTGERGPVRLEDWSYPVGPVQREVQMEAQARVFVSRVVRASRCVACEHPPGVDLDDLKREMSVQIRRARKLAFEDAARYVADALDFDGIHSSDKLPPEFKDALRRVNVLARMLRGPGDDSGSDR
jgi:hypothetical protein